MLFEALALTSSLLCPDDSIRYHLDVNKYLYPGIRVTRIDFAKAVLRTLNDPYGWEYAGKKICLVPDWEPADFQIVLAGPKVIDALCAPMNTGGEVSCWNDGIVAINYKRWMRPTKIWEDLYYYREYVINHEVGHALGMTHRNDKCEEGGYAPLMMQQSRDRLKCSPNSLPTYSEIRSLRRRYKSRANQL